MDQRTPAVSPSGWDPGALLDFVDELRRAEYNVGSEQYVAAQDLVLLLTAEGQRLEVDRLRSMLGPLLCSTPREQEDFSSRFESWASRLTSGVRESIAPPPGTADQQPDREATSGSKFQSLWKWGLGLAVTVLITSIALYVDLHGARETTISPPEVGDDAVVPPPPPSPLPPPPPSPTRVDELKTSWVSWLAPATVMVALAFVWWRYRAHLFLARWAVAGKPEIRQVAVASLNGQLFHGVSLARTARELRQRREIPSQDLDVSATVAETVRRAGWLVPVYGTRQLTPEYLMLVDRASYRDHQAKLVDDLLERLRTNGVLITRYYFDADPRVCFPFAEGASPLTLGELATKHPDHRLLVFSDAARLFNSRTGELEPWAAQFLYWQERTLLTPIPRAHWGLREAVLFRQFATLPTTPAGVASLVRSTGRDQPAAEQDVTAPFPRELRRRPLRWLESRAPRDSRVVESTLAAVRRYLGEAGFYWLRACAVYPALDWNLTLYLGNHLRTAKGGKLLQLHRLTALARLPWFRHGLMPDWLRERLLEGLPRDQQDDIRSVLNRLLRSAPKVTGGGGFRLEIARKLLPGSGESPLRDYVFVTIMAGRRLGVKLPRRAERAFPEPIFPGPLKGLANRLLQALDGLLHPRPRWAEVLVLLLSLAALALVPTLVWRLDTPPAAAWEDVKLRRDIDDRDAPDGSIEPPPVVNASTPTALGPPPPPVTASTPTIVADSPPPAEGDSAPAVAIESPAGGDSTPTVVVVPSPADVSASAPVPVAEFPPADMGDVTELPPIADIGPPPAPVIEPRSTSGVDFSHSTGRPEAEIEASLEPIEVPVSLSDQEDLKRFIVGIRALDFGDWDKAAETMLQAQRSTERNGERVNIHAMRFELYLPHFYRGVALYRLGRCADALAEWQESERRGAITEKRARKEYGNLKDLREKCNKRRREE